MLTARDHMGPVARTPRHGHHPTTLRSNKGHDKVESHTRKPVKRRNLLLDISTSCARIMEPTRKHNRLFVFRSPKQGDEPDRVES